MARSTMTVAAVAKGNFQAQGIVSEVQRSGDAITFRFVGRIQLVYSSGAIDPQAPQKLIEFESASVLIHVAGWIQRYNPTEAAEQPDTELTYTTLAALAKSERLVVLSVDNPSLTFSNTGSPVQVSGTYVYARESGR
jgi:hypothetical protein